MIFPNFILRVSPCLKSILLVTSMLATVVSISANTLVSFDFANGSPTPSVAKNVSVSSIEWVGIEGGFGRKGNDLFVETSYIDGSFDGSRYVSITVVADSGYFLVPESFSYALGGSRNQTGPEILVEAVVRTNVDTANLEVSPGNLTISGHRFQELAPSYTQYTTDLSEAKYQGFSSLTLRIYVRASASSSQIYLRLDSLTLKGTVVPGESRVPEKLADISKDDMDASLNQPDMILKLTPLFSDHAVLQRGKPLPVWGVAKPGTEVTVDFSGQSLTAKADENGQWEAEFSPLSAEIAGRDFTVKSESRKIVLKDVVVGDVWLCSGQSNMAWPLRSDPNAERIIAASDLPLIRQFLVDRVALEEPSPSAKGSWKPCLPETAGEFTAVGYYFARELQPKIGVPIGLINSTWGGTAIEAWMSETALERFPEVDERWQKIVQKMPEEMVAYELERAEFKRKAAEAKISGAEFDFNSYPGKPEGNGSRKQPFGIFNGMVAPLIPYSLSGILWYQGESNVGNAKTYRDRFQVHISDWRERWGQERMPFYFVQLPNYDWDYDKSGVKWAEFREAQMQALSLPETGAVVVIDGDDPIGHPADKTEIGRRLARMAGVRYYELFAGDATGPLLETVTRKQKEIVLTFSNATSGLEIKGGNLEGFQLAGKDGAFVDADAALEDGSVVVSAPMVPDPVQVRYAWQNNPTASLYNGAGLPASPFVAEIE